MPPHQRIHQVHQICKLETPNIFSIDLQISQHLFIAAPFAMLASIPGSCQSCEGDCGNLFKIFSLPLQLPHY
jgi:hypothetical protein